MCHDASHVNLTEAKGTMIMIPDTRAKAQAAESIYHSQIRKYAQITLRVAESQYTVSEYRTS